MARKYTDVIKIINDQMLSLEKKRGNSPREALPWVKLRG